MQYDSGFLGLAWILIQNLLFLMANVVKTNKTHPIKNRHENSGIYFMYSCD